jgi:hypothetical protein
LRTRSRTLTTTVTCERKASGGRAEGGMDLPQDVDDGTAPCALIHGGVLWPGAHGNGDDQPLPGDHGDDGVKGVVDGGLVEDDPDGPPAPLACASKWKLSAYAPTRFHVLPRLPRAVQVGFGRGGPD